MRLVLSALAILVLLLAPPAQLASAAASVELHNGDQYAFTVDKGDDVSLSAHSSPAVLTIVHAGHSSTVLISCDANRARLSLKHKRTAYRVECHGKKHA